MTAIRGLTLVLALALLAAPQARAQDKSSGLKIGIVDLGVVFNEYGKKRQLEVDIQKQKNLYDEEIRKQTNMIRKLNEDLEELKGDKYEELAERLQLEIARRDIMKKRYEKKIRDQLIDMTLKLLDEINATVAKYGRENGYALILKVDDQGFGAKEEFREKIFRAQVQSVLYFDKTIDLTEVVLKDLNKNFKPEEAGKMSELRAQRTLASAIEFDGIGIHTGAPVRVRCVPAPVDSGLVFHRSDLPGTGPIPANAQYRVDRPRRTALADESGKAEVHTVEHMLSAAHAMGLDNMTVFMDGPEAPGMDGSALNFWEKFAGAGLVDQDAKVKPLVLQRTIGLSHGGASVVAMPSSEPGLHLTYVLVYPVATLGAQVLELRLDPERFQKEIAPARTFCLEAEARALQAAGLGKGANTQNTVIYGEAGVIDTQLRFADEAVRHKMLDLIGDLALLGRALQARVIAIKSGHELNAELVKELRKLD